ncbi:MAG: hypothetical protein SO119_07380 [Phascolarctobacterium sp.]|nr:hypothetical protein [Phascolarctobacterium sp.]
MLNILFALFLFGMLVTLCAKAFMRAMKEEQPLNSKEAALLVALAVGSLIALSAGASSVYHVQLITF